MWRFKNKDAVCAFFLQGSRTSAFTFCIVINDGNIFCFYCYLFLNEVLKLMRPGENEL